MSSSALDAIQPASRTRRKRQGGGATNGSLAVHCDSEADASSLSDDENEALPPFRSMEQPPSPINEEELEESEIVPSGTRLSVTIGSGDTPCRQLSLPTPDIVVEPRGRSRRNLKAHSRRSCSFTLAHRAMARCYRAIDC